MAIYTDYDPVTKVKTIVERIDRDTLGIRTVHDASDIVEINKAKMASTDERARWGELTHVASIPMPFLRDLQRRGVIGPRGNVIDQAALAKFLNDRDYLKFRVRPGRI